MLRAEIRIAIRSPATIDGITVRRGKEGGHAFDDLGRRRQSPARSFDEGWEELFVLAVHPGMGFTDGVLQYLLCLRIWVERLALFDADALQQIDHRLVPRLPVFVLHD